MKYGKIENGIVTDVVNGLKPDGYVLITNKTISPTEYPIDFYAKGSSEPLYTVVGKGIDENLEFILRPIEQIKDLIFDMQRVKRHKGQAGSFVSSGVTVKLIDREDISNIRGLDLSIDDPYKVRSNVWIEGVERDQLIIDANNYIRPLFKAERDDNTLVDAMTTVDELKTYYDSM